MFYASHRSDGSDYKKTSAIVVLTPAESRRLIARAVAQLPEVRHALYQGRIVIGNGTTNAYVAEELLGVSVAKVNYAAGIITQGKLSVVPDKERLSPIVLLKGRVADIPVNVVLKDFTSEDIFIKGANAVDMWGNAGILVGSEVGGTIGQALPIVVARGCHLIVPVGLEKLIPSVMDASGRCGTLRFTRATGIPVGFMPLVGAKVVTEIQALKVLAGVMAIHLASGGVGGSEGSVVLALEGEEKPVAQAFELVERIKGEAPIAQESV